MRHALWLYQGGTPTVNSTSTESPRIWGGTTLATRQKARREKLLSVGLDLLGSPSSTLSVRAACRAAQLTERYFYESFADRDALVLAVYEEVADAARASLEEATRTATDPVDVARRSVEAMVSLMVDDRAQGAGAAGRADHRAGAGRAAAWSSRPHHRDDPQPAPARAPRNGPAR